MIIKVIPKKSAVDGKAFRFPMGYIDEDCAHIGSITLDLNGCGGKINQERAVEIIVEAIEKGADILIKFNDVSIELR